MRRTRAENAEFVIAAVKALGLQPHPQSRLMRMHRALTSASFVTWDSPDFETALEAERDLQVLAFVFENGEAQSPESEFGSLVKAALKDSVLPQDDRTQSKGRDAQFELFVAAICQSAGMHPVARQEPDVTCTVRGVKFAIAAKRLKSLASLGKRVREAALQIQKAALPGIIALDTSGALNRENKRITKPIPDREFGPLYKHGVDLFITEYHERLQEWVRGPTRPYPSATSSSFSRFRSFALS